MPDGATSVDKPLNEPAHRIKTWKQFAREVRSQGCQLLKRLDEFPNSILVAGCQRSGTTVLSRVLTGTAGMVNYWFGKDDELAAALLLAGRVAHEPRGRYCFQTTYVNECYHEYFAHRNGHRLIWVLRNPFSVVYSLVYHWRRFAFNELFRACGMPLLDADESKRYRRFGVWGVNRVTRACLSYQGKVSQIFEISKRMGEDRVLVVEYDDIVEHRDKLLPYIYDFVDLSFKNEYGQSIHARSLRKAEKLSSKEFAKIETLCVPVYHEAKKFIRYRL